PMQNMMAVLPDGLYHYQRCIWRQGPENFHPVLLAVDEPMSLLRIAVVAPAHVAPFAADGFDDGVFGLGLRRPTLLIAPHAHVPISYDDYGLRHVPHRDLPMPPLLARSLHI